MEKLIDFISNPINIAAVVFGAGLSYVIWQKADKTKSEQLRGYIPTLWTSIGILGTFVSIYIALKPTIEDVSELINDIVPAFSTSIIGIAGAVIMSTWIKYRDSERESAEEESYRNKTNTDSPEDLLFEVKSSIVANGQQMVSSVDGVVKSVENLIQSVESSISGLSANIAKDLSTIIGHEEDFHTQINQEFHDALKEQQTVIDERYNKQEALFAENTKQLIESVKDEIQRIDQNHVDTINNLVRLSQESIKNTCEMLGKESENRNNLFTLAMDGYKKELEVFFNTQNTIATQVHTDISNDIARHSQRIEDFFVNDLHKAIEAFAQHQMQETMSILEQFNRSLTDALKESEEHAMDNNNAVLDLMRDKLRDAVDSMCSSMEAMKNNLVSEMSACVSANATSVGIATQDICNINSDNMQKVADSMKSDYETWLVELKDLRKQYSGQLSADEKIRIDAAKDFYSKVESMMTASMNNINSKVASFSQHVSDMDTVLRDFADHATSDSQAVYDAYIIRIGEIVDRMKKEYSDWENIIKTNNSQLVKALSDEEANHFSKTRDVYATADRQLAQLLQSINTHGRTFTMSMDGVIQEIRNLFTTFEREQKDQRDFIVSNNANLASNISHQITESFKITDLERACSDLILQMQEYTKQMKQQFETPQKNQRQMKVDQTAAQGSSMITHNRDNRGRGQDSRDFNRRNK